MSAESKEGGGGDFTGDFILRLGHPQLEHHHCLLGGVVWVLVVDQIQIGIGDLQALGQRDPIATEEVANIRQAQISLIIKAQMH